MAFARLSHPTRRGGVLNQVVASDADIAEVQRLFSEYAAWVGVDLSFHDFDRELAELPGDYVLPAGVLFVARVDGEVAGCVAAHQWGGGACEM
jgi:hypothetical protein